jgi:hypothetical protein
MRRMVISFAAVARAQSGEIFSLSATLTAGLNPA